MIRRRTFIFLTIAVLVIYAISFVPYYESAGPDAWVSYGSILPEFQNFLYIELVLALIALTLTIIYWHRPLSGDFILQRQRFTIRPHLWPALLLLLILRPFNSSPTNRYFSTDSIETYQLSTILVFILYLLLLKLGVRFFRIYSIALKGKTLIFKKPFIKTTANIQTLEVIVEDPKNRTVELQFEDGYYNLTIYTPDYNEEEIKKIVERLLSLNPKTVLNPRSKRILPV